MLGSVQAVTTKWYVKGMEASRFMNRKKWSFHSSASRWLPCAGMGDAPRSSALATGGTMLFRKPRAAITHAQKAPAWGADQLPGLSITKSWLSSQDSSGPTDAMARIPERGAVRASWPFRSFIRARIDLSAVCCIARTHCPRSLGSASIVT
jgi:hypothetical protein